MSQQNELENQDSSPYSMTEEILQKRLLRTSRGRYITQFYAALTASFGSLSFGTMIGWSSPMLVHQTYIIENLTADEQTWVASIVAIGAACGVIPWTYCNTRFGPKKTMLLQAPFNILSWVLLASVIHFNSFMAARFFCGLLSVSYIISGECLLTDTVHTRNLEHMMVMYRSSVLLGVLLTWLMGQLLDKWSATSICAVFALVHAVMLMFLPESPVFLYDKSAVKAEEAIVWYRGQKNISLQMRAVRQHCEMRKVDPELYKDMLYAQVVVKGMLIVMGIKFFQICSSYHLFLFYNVHILREVEDMTDHLHDSLIYGFLMYFSNFAGMLIHYKTFHGIRKPLILSSIFVTMVLITFASYLYCVSHRIPIPLQAHFIVPVTCVCLLILAYETGLSTYAEIALCDYMPHEVYQRAKNILKIWEWILIFFAVKYLISIRNITKSYVTFLLLAVVEFLGIFYICFFVVETKGKSLIQVQRDIGGNPIGSRDAYRRVAV